MKQLIISFKITTFNCTINWGDIHVYVQYFQNFFLKYFTVEIFHTVKFCYVEAIEINLKILLCILQCLSYTMYKEIITMTFDSYFYFAFDCISGLMVSVLTLSVIDREFESQSSQTIDKICFYAKHTELRRKNKDWLARNQDNVSE